MNAWDLITVYTVARKMYVNLWEFHSFLHEFGIKSDLIIIEEDANVTQALSKW